MTIYEICLRLGMTVGRFLEEATYEELLGWIAYFSVRPFGWESDDRAFKLMRVQGLSDNKKPWDVFPKLNIIYNAPVVSGTEFNVNSLKTSSFMTNLNNSVGGEKIPL